MKINDFVIKLLGTPFKDKGRDYEGIDCYGVLYLAYRDALGVTLPILTDDYPDAGMTAGSRKAINDLVILNKHSWEKVNYPCAFDVALFRMGDTNTHVGLMIDRNRFIHCERKINVNVERLDSVRWNKRLEGVYRLRSTHG